MLSEQEKIAIAKNIKDISIDDVEEEMAKLIKIGTKANMISERSKIGNNIVDYFTSMYNIFINKN